MPASGVGRNEDSTDSIGITAFVRSRVSACLRLGDVKPVGMVFHPWHPWCDSCV